MAADQNGFLVLVASRSLEKQAPFLFLSPGKQSLGQAGEAHTANARRGAQTNAQQYQAAVMIEINILVLTALNLENALAQGTLYVVQVELV